RPPLAVQRNARGHVTGSGLNEPTTSPEEFAPAPDPTSVPASCMPVAGLHTNTWASPPEETEDCPNTWPAELMANAELNVPPSVPRSCIPVSGVQGNACSPPV